MKISEEEFIQNLKQQGKVIPAIRDTIFKKVMMDHLDYLAVILENIIDIFKEQIMEHGIFINNEIPSNHIFKKNSITDLTFQVGNITIDIEANYKYSTALNIRNHRHILDLAGKEFA